MIDNKAGDALFRRTIRPRSHLIGAFIKRKKNRPGERAALSQTIKPEGES